MRRPTGSQLIFAAHVLVAAFVALFRYPCTQDGPAHVYTVHVLRAIAEDPTSPYHRFFVPSVHFGSNGFFFYFGLWAGRFVRIETVTSFVFFSVLVLTPLSALAFARALRATVPASSPLPEKSAWTIACVLAYSYFLYRGLYNYSLGIPLSFLTLAAVVAQGAEMGAGARIGLFVSGLVAAALAAFAHASAIAFLIFAIPVATIAGGCKAPKARWVAGAITWLFMLASTLTSHIGSEGPPDGHWWTPWKSLAMLVRAFGVTQSWLEVIPAIAILVVLVVTAARNFPRIGDLVRWTTVRARYDEVWPVLLGFAVAGGYFVVPNAYRGITGVNERLPLFAGMLILPYVSTSWRPSRVLGWAFAPFALYVAIVNARLEHHVRAMREAAVAVPIERGATLYVAALDLKLGSVSADLGRYLGADVARLKDAVTGDVFYGNPVFPLQGTSETPPAPADPGPVQDFSHMNDAERRAALADPKSPLRTYFDETAKLARSSKYLLVVPYAPLEEAFRVHVLDVLGATPAKGSSPLCPVYVLPQRATDRAPAEHEQDRPTAPVR